MNTLETYRLYDAILKYVSSPRTMATVEQKFIHSVVRDKQKAGRDAIDYLRSAGLLKIHSDGFKLTPSGIDRLYTTFESEYVTREVSNKLYQENLQETTSLAKEQRNDIRKSRKRSNWAIFLSVFALSVSVADFIYKIYPETHRNHKSDEHNNDTKTKPIVKDSVVTKIKDTLNDTE